MAIFIAGKTSCKICQQIVGSSEEAVAFPAFVPQGHEFTAFSDGVFHENCFRAWEDHERFQTLYENYQRVWSSRPSGLSFKEIEEWGKQAFTEVFRAGMIEKL